MFYVKVGVFLAEVLLKLGDFILRLDIVIVEQPICVP